MAVETATLDAAGETTSGVLVDKGQALMINVAGTFVATWKIQFQGAGDSAYRDMGITYDAPATKYFEKAPVRGHWRVNMSARTSGSARATLYS
jgi:hypothetical protein